MKLRPSLAAALLLLPACNGTSGLGNTEIPPPSVASVHGTLALSSAARAAPPGSIRVELSWFTPFTENTRIVAQDIAVTTSLPASFELPLQGAPPSQVMWTSTTYSRDAGQWNFWHLPVPAPGQSFALGEVLAYEDLNGNGKLDTVGVDATSAPDRILAADAGKVFYAAGGYAESAWPSTGTSREGFGLLGDYDDAGIGLAWFPITTELQVMPTGSEWNLMMCTNYDALEENSDNTGVDALGAMSLFYAPIAPAGLVFPPANQPLLVCSPGGTQYCINACPAPDNQFYVCQSYDTSAVLNEAKYCTGRFGADPACYTMPATEPAGWPCTYTPGVDCPPDPNYNRCATDGSGVDAGGTIGSPDSGVFGNPGDGGSWNQPDATLSSDGG